MPHHLLIPLPPTPTGEPPAGLRGRSGEAEAVAGPGDFAALLAQETMSAGHGETTGPEPLAIGAEDPLGALIAAFGPADPDSDDALPLPDWLRAALLAPGGGDPGGLNVGASNDGAAQTSDTGTDAFDIAASIAGTRVAQSRPILPGDMWPAHGKDIGPVGGLPDAAPDASEPWTERRDGPFPGVARLAELLPGPATEAPHPGNGRTLGTVGTAATGAAIFGPPAVTGSDGPAPAGPPEDLDGTPETAVAGRVGNPADPSAAAPALAVAGVRGAVSATGRDAELAGLRWGNPGSTAQSDEPEATAGTQARGPVVGKPPVEEAKPSAIPIGRAGGGVPTPGGAVLASDAPPVAPMSGRVPSVGDGAPSAETTEHVDEPVHRTGPPPAPAPMAELLFATGSPREMASTPAAPTPLPQLREAMAEQVRMLAGGAEGDGVSLRTAPGQAEVELAPADLGRLRLQLSTTERGLHLTVLVERPESLDAVRRHLDGLHRSLIAEGVTLDGIDIGTGARGQDQGTGGSGRPRQDGDDRPDGRPLRPPTSDPAEIPTPSPAPIIGTGRLDIRL